MTGTLFEFRPRSVDEIRAKGVGRLTEHELAWLCDLAKTLAACAMSTVAITPAEAERLLTGRVKQLENAPVDDGQGSYLSDGTLAFRLGDLD